MHQSQLKMLALLFSLSGHAQLVEHQSNCWDGSFAYRVASLNVMADGVELGVFGQFSLFNEISGDGLRDWSGILAGNSFHGEAIYAAFTPSQCTMSELGVISCEATASADDWYLLNNVFVERSIQDLDERISLISPLIVRWIKAEISTDKVKMEFFDQTHKHAPQRVALIEFSLVQCDINGDAGGTFFGSAFFPKKLRDYLARNEAK